MAITVKFLMYYENKRLLRPYDFRRDDVIFVSFVTVTKQVLGAFIAGNSVSALNRFEIKTIIVIFEQIQTVLKLLNRLHLGFQTVFKKGILIRTFNF